MKLRIAVIVILCMGLCCSFAALSNQASAQAKKAAPAGKPEAMPKITVLSPLGTPAPIQRKPQAPRLSTLDGKTVFLVNTGYIGTDRLMNVMTEWFKTNHPTTKIEYRVSKGGMTNVDKGLWAEMSEKADAVVLGLGH
jgi:hypothetical protein